MLRPYPDRKFRRICDNGRFHHTAAVRAWLQVHRDRITVFSLPPYSPRLNVIARLWGHLKPTLLSESPPLRVLLVLDKLVGHKTPALVCWLFENAIMPLYTPVGGSWPNMAECPQRIFKWRSIDSQDSGSSGQIIAWFEAVARHWIAAPTPLVWAASERNADGGNGSDIIASAARAPVPGRRARDTRGRFMAMRMPLDPLN